MWSSNLVSFFVPMSEPLYKTDKQCGNKCTKFEMKNYTCTCMFARYIFLCDTIFKVIIITSQG